MERDNENRKLVVFITTHQRAYPTGSEADIGGSTERDDENRKLVVFITTDQRPYPTRNEADIGGSTERDNENWKLVVFITTKQGHENRQPSLLITRKKSNEHLYILHILCTLYILAKSSCLYCINKRRQCDSRVNCVGSQPRHASRSRTPLALKLGDSLLSHRLHRPRPGNPPAPHHPLRLDPLEIAGAGLKSAGASSYPGFP